MPGIRIRVTLTNGEERDLSEFDEDIIAHLDAFEKKKPPFNRDWYETTNSTMIARDHIVEYHGVPA